MKTLKLTVLCEAYYTSHIDVPEDMTFEEAIEYAKKHIGDIPIDGGLEWAGNDVLDIENCELEGNYD